MLPAIRGVIDRRILVNYRFDPEALAAVLPDPFDPRTVGGYGVGGVCLIRFRALRPRWLPPQFGVGSENAAHRIAVEWTDDGDGGSGVYVPRRDTNSRFNTLAGGRLFPGVHHHATFDVAEEDGYYDVAMTGDDDRTHVRVAGEPTDSLPEDSVFDSLSAASRFFEEGSVGHSPNERTGEYEALELHTDEWEVRPLAVDRVESTFFEDFEEGAVAFDHALLMEDVDHEWRTGEAVCSVPASN